MTVRRLARRSALGISSTVAIGAAFVLVAPAQAAVMTINPFEGSNGFTVVTQGDAVFGNGEIEGSIAVTGTISASKQNYPIRHQAAGSGDYTIPTVDGVPTRVLANGFGGADGTGIAVTNQNAPDEANRGIAKLVSTDGLNASERGGWTRVSTGDPNSAAVLDLEALPWTDADSALAAIQTELDSVEAYLDVSAYATAQQCLAEGYASAAATDPADQLMHIVSPNMEGSMALPGPFATDKPNVFEYADFVGANPIKPDNLGGWIPSADAPLIIRVPAGTTTVSSILIEGWSPSLDAQQDYSQYVMYDLSAVTGEVTIDGVEIGAIFAPNADVTFTGSRTQNGQWVTQSLTTGGGGEIHHYAFGGNILCDLADDPDADADADADAADAADADAADAADADADAADADADADVTDADATDSDADATDADAADATDADADADVTDADATDSDADATDADATDADATDADAADAADADADADVTDADATDSDADATDADATDADAADAADTDAADADATDADATDADAADADADADADAADADADATDADATDADATDADATDADADAADAADADADAADADADADVTDADATDSDADAADADATDADATDADAADAADTDVADADAADAADADADATDSDAADADATDAADADTTDVADAGGADAGSADADDADATDGADTDAADADGIADVADDDLATTGGGAPLMLLGSGLVLLLAGAAVGLFARARREV